MRELRTHSMQLEERLGRAMEQSIGDRRHALAILAERFKGLSPLDKLSHGYAYAEDAKGKVLLSIAGVKPGDGITGGTDGGCPCMEGGREGWQQKSLVWRRSLQSLRKR